MSRLSKRIARMVPPIKRRQDQIEELKSQLRASRDQIRGKDAQLKDLKQDYESKLRRSREEAQKWRKLTRSKVKQLEEKSAELARTTAHPESADPATRTPENEKPDPRESPRG